MTDNNDILLYIVLGALQGFLEWLPISSSAQVTVIGTFLGLKLSESLKFAFYLHIASGFAALFYLRKNILELIVRSKSQSLNSPMLKLIMAVGVSFLIAYPIDRLLIDLFENLDLNYVMGIIGILLVITGFLMTRKGRNLKDEPSLYDLIVTGILQGFSILPGISRSGITFSALLLMGVKEDSALIWSYVMGIPVVIAAGVYHFLKMSFHIDIVCIVFSGLAAFILGIASIGGMLKLSEKLSYEHLTISLGVLYILLSIIWF